MHTQTDFLVIGSGIAGLSFALKVAQAGTVTILTKGDRDESATKYAQGGIASVLDANDSFASHIEDTLEAGAGLCKPDVVEMVVEGGPERISELIDLGVRFTHRKGKKNSEYDLAREGGHSARRIIHAQDLTGQEVERALVQACNKHKRITFLEDHICVDLITPEKLGRKKRKKRCLGAYALDKKSGEVKTFSAKATLLATGGSGKVYLYASNPDIATGDGIAMAYRVGCSVANMEFVQFHPTCLYHPSAKSFLVSEAVRGEGAILKRIDGTSFMRSYNPKRELAPRDIVARAIDNEMKVRGDDHVMLDISHKSAAFIRNRFPNISRTCKSFGYDMTKGPIPVVPAAHYQCGGIVTDMDGATELEGLYAVGETACTGLHGANRLASNSLLEALVYAHRAAGKAMREIKDVVPQDKLPPWDIGHAVDSDESVVVSHNWDEIRRTMWNYVGIVRTTKRLERAMNRIRLIQDEIAEYYWDFLVTGDLIELRNLTTVAELILMSAMNRKESRGLHYNLDYRRTEEDQANDTVIKDGKVIQ